MTNTERKTSKMKTRRLQNNYSVVMTREWLNQVEQKVQLSFDCVALSPLASVRGCLSPIPSRERSHAN